MNFDSAHSMNRGLSLRKKALRGASTFRALRKCSGWGGNRPAATACSRFAAHRSHTLT